MSDRNCIRLLLIAVPGLMPAALLANGMRLASQDGFATARGEAFAATADNPSAIYYNPAGITQSESNSVRGGIYGIYLDPGYERPAPADTNTFHIENRLAAVPQFFYTWTPSASPVTLGLGLYAPFGLGVRWPQDTGFRAVAIEGALTFFTFNPVLALKLAPTLSIGGGLTVNYANLELEQGLLRTERPFENYFRFKGDGWSVGYNLGVLWQPLEQISFGAAFRGSSTVNLKGHTEIEQQPIIRVTTRSAHAEFDFPMSVVVGLSFRPTPQWNLEFDADFTDWSNFDTPIIKQADPPFPLRPNTPVTLKWRGSWMYEFGVTRYFGSRWHVSAGYVFNENSVPDAYYTPLASDLDRHFLSVGVGRKGKRFDFDIAYQFGYGPARTVSGSTPSSTPGRFVGQNADGTYNFLSHAVLGTVGMRF